MRFFRRGATVPLPLSPTDARTEDMTVDSSEDLSALLNDMEVAQVDLEVMPTRENAVWLDEKILLEQGKAHKNQILTSWVACQSYLSQTETEARTRQLAFRMTLGTDDSSTMSDMASRSGLTSRTSSCTTNTQPNNIHKPSVLSGHPQKELTQRTSQHRNRFSSFAPNRKAKTGGKALETIGFSYDSYPGCSSMIHLVHDDSARIEEEWARLNSAFKSSLYMPGPKGGTKRLIHKVT